MTSTRFGGRMGSAGLGGRGRGFGRGGRGGGGGGRGGLGGALGGENSQRGTFYFKIY